MQNRRRGYKSKKNGDVFEDLIQASNIYYSREGVAAVEKTPEPLRMVGKSPRPNTVLAIFEKKGQPDFAGTLKGGKSVMFEAKHTDGTSIRFDRISATQAKYLTEHAKLGAECFVIISFGFKEFFAVGWSEWLLLEVKTGKKSVNPKDLQEYRINYKNGRLYYLGGV